MLSLRNLYACVLAAAGWPAAAGVFLTADVSETPGMAGYWTYDLTATADDGYVNGFDFTDHNDAGRGIFGPLHHGGDPSSPLYGLVDPVFGGSTGSKADTHWLVSSNELLSIGVGQSSGSLTSASVFSGSSEHRNAYRSLPFARLVTNDPMAVNLTGKFVVGQQWSDGGAGESVVHDVRLSLSEITVGAPPALGGFPDRPLPPVLPDPPVVLPPTYVPPTFEPPTYIPPSYVPPVIVPPTIDPVTPSRVVLSAEAFDTPGLPGYRTYTVTATAIDGFLNAFDFTNFAGGTKGISGPLHQGSADGQDFFADRLFATGAVDPADSQWLVSLDSGLAIGADQSGDSLQAAYTFTGSGGLRDTFRSLPLAQLVTNDPSAVTLAGEFALADAWSDGAVSKSWQSHVVGVSATLSDLVGVTPPVLGALPDRPVAPQPPVVVTQPPVVEAPTEPIDVPTVVVDPPVLIEVPAGELPSGGIVLPPFVDYPLIEIGRPVVDVSTGVIELPPTFVTIDTTWITDYVGSVWYTTDLTAWDLRPSLTLAYDGDLSGVVVRYSGMGSLPMDGALALNLLSDERALIPEPGAVLLVGAGLLAMGARRER